MENNSQLEKTIGKRGIVMSSKMEIITQGNINYHANEGYLSVNGRKIEEGDIKRINPSFFGKVLICLNGNHRYQ